MTLSYILAVIFGGITGVFAASADYLDDGEMQYAVLGFIHLGTLLWGSLGLAFVSFLAAYNMVNDRFVLVALVGLGAALATAWVAGWVLPYIGPAMKGLQALFQGV